MEKVVMAYSPTTIADDRLCQLGIRRPLTTLLVFRLGMGVA